MSAAATLAGPRRSASGIRPRLADPPLTQANVEHLLRRTEYVARPSRVTALMAKPNLAAAVDDVLDVPPSVALPNYLTYHDSNNSYDQWVFAVQWWLDRMAFDSPKPMQEKMTWFWHGHFCTSWDKVSDTRLMMAQNKLFRDSCMGNFVDLTHDMSLQPAMLIYLDNVYNYASDPNQNFARELLELFTLGVGNYTEADVAAAARAWTGHGIDWDTYDYKFWSEDHDDNNKTFFGTTKNWDGPDIIDEVLVDNTAKREIAQRFISKRLWEHFAYQDPEPEVLDALQASLEQDPKWDIKRCVRTMLLHPNFYGTTAVQGRVQQPVDWTAVMMYRAGLRGDVANPQWSLDGMGQIPYAPPNVSGWRHNMYCINTSMLASRADAARGLTWRLRDGDANRIHGKTNGVFDYTPAQAVAYFENLFGLNYCPTTRTALENYVIAQRAAQTYGDWWESTNLLTMSLLTPECHMA